MRTLILLLVFPVLVHALEVPAGAKDVVVPVFTKAAPNAAPAGLAFFLALPAAARTEHLYVVTAASVVKDRKKIWLRMNRRAADAEMVEVGLTLDRVLPHPDPAVDVVAILFAPDPAVYEYRHLHLADLGDATAAVRFGVAEGSDTCFAGIFSPSLAAKRIVPAIHFGRLSLVPTATIPLSPDDRRVVYLMESRASAADVGAPVFIYSRKVPQTLMLGGVLSSGATGTGFNAVTPGSLLRELLETPAANQQRTGARSQPEYY